MNVTWSTMRSLIFRRRFYCSHLWRRSKPQNAGVLRWRRHCSHTSGLRRRKSRSEPQNSPQIALHCSHTTPRGKSRRKPRTANRFIVAVALIPICKLYIIQCWMMVKKWLVLAQTLKLYGYYLRVKEGENGESERHTGCCSVLLVVSVPRLKTW